MNDTEKRKSIYELQTMLLTLSRAYGLPRVIPDGIYGSETRDAVAEFQKSVSLPVTGVVDLVTWNALYEADRRVRADTMPPRTISPFDTFLEGGVLRFGDRFPTIYIIQAMLEELSHLYEFETAVVLSGIFDDATEAAVRLIQRSLDLDDDGIIDKATWDELALLYNRSLKYPE